MAKYTDEQIKKALELCVNWEAETCEKCPFDDECESDGSIPLRSAFDLIKRQEAEIEELKETLNATIAGQETLQKYIPIAKSEAIKEFAERLKDMSEHFWEEKENFVSEGDIDNLVAEMVGEGE